MKRTFIASVILFSLSATSLFAQQNEEVRQVIASMFEGMKSKNTDLIKAAFHQDATMQTVKSGESGSELGSNSVADFVNRIATTPATTILDERILDYQIKVDGDMAAAWTPYEFYVNDNFSHCGVNSFQLIKTTEGWKITYIIDTRRKEGCK
ncbi:nuclear transport factor 2 family protein [Aquiflexum sp. LQ15W]|uniref:nuclear transport factor 2 family protein n=1 Tax=Cognataquiflexum nitidum TaxID=2922272 RepID=UPI001F13DB93|nr:nuclear transport factor 2 family protein [Cognataquiflexum nitidum]MCH6198499.1 nuclear transport factor 2 family protein [Cognataquiflexum nitidum]